MKMEDGDGSERDAEQAYIVINLLMTQDRKKNTYTACIKC